MMQSRSLRSTLSPPCLPFSFSCQNELPLLCDWDKDCIKTLGQEFEIDFISLSYVRTAEDVLECYR